MNERNWVHNVVPPSLIVLGVFHTTLCLIRSHVYADRLGMSHHSRHQLKVGAKWPWRFSFCTLQESLASVALRKLQSSPETDLIIKFKDPREEDRQCGIAMYRHPFKVNLISTNMWRKFIRNPMIRSNPPPTNGLT